MIKSRIVGLSEAVINFTEDFTDEPCQYLYTTTTCQVFQVVEDNICFVMTVINDNKKSKCCVGLYQKILNLAYKTFCFFHGTCSFILKNNNSDYDCLSKYLECFFDSYLSTLSSNSFSLLNAEGYMKFFCLEKNNFMRVYCSMNRLSSSFSDIACTALFFNDEIVWSGLNNSDMRILYYYITKCLLPKSRETKNESRGQKLDQYGRFLHGPSDFSKDEKPVLPVVHICNGTEVTKSYYLVVYTTLSSTLCMLVNSNNPPNEQWFRNVHDYLDVQQSSLAADIYEEWVARKQE